MIDRLASEQRLGEALQRPLDPLRRRLLRGELRVHVRVPEAADDQPALLVLVPVVVAVPAVVRHREQALGERLRRDHLPARRDDQPLELSEQAARVAVGGDEDGLGLELVQVLDPVVLPDLDAGLRRGEREPPHEPRRLQDGVVRMEERARETAGQRLWELVAPLGGEAVLAQRLVLRPQLVPLVVPGEPETARPADRVAAELDHPVDVRLRQAPIVRSGIVAEPLTRAVVCHRPAAEGKPTVAAAGAGGDRARLVQAHALPQACERERGRDAGDATADDLDVGRPRERLRAEARSGFGKPEGVGHAAMLAGSTIDTVLLVHEARELELGQQRPPIRRRKARSRA